MNWPATIENIATIIATVALTIALWTLGAGGWSFMSYGLLLNLNYPDGK